MDQMANAARLASQLMTNPTFATDSPTVTPHSGSTDSAGGQCTMSQTDIMALLRQLGIPVKKRVAAPDLLDDNPRQLKRFVACNEEEKVVFLDMRLDGSEEAEV